MTIKILPETIASQIAAGEVVERPASAVKELIENAIDAGASAISVETSEAGKRLIAVADNGSGIPAEELPLAIARHATSKLQSAEDLFEIHTLGFRGEALASIGSVARLTLTSKPEAQLAGYRLRVDGGIVGASGSVPAPTGSEVRVEDLFFNVPARMKFLKSDSTENRQITGLVTRYALAYPHIRWNLIQDQRTVFKTTGSLYLRASRLGSSTKGPRASSILARRTCRFSSRPKRPQAWTTTTGFCMLPPLPSTRQTWMRSKRNCSLRPGHE